MILTYILLKVKFSSVTKTVEGKDARETTRSFSPGRGMTVSFPEGKCKDVMQWSYSKYVLKVKMKDLLMNKLDYC